MPMTSPMRATLIPIALAFATGCSTLTTITTRPTGAKVYVQDQYRGPSPVQVDLNNGFIDGASYHVRVEMPGYKRQEVMLEQEVSAGAIVGDILLLVPTLGLSAYLCVLNCKQHRDRYDFLLEPDDGAPR